MSPETAPRVLDQNARTNRSLRRLVSVGIALALLLNAVTAGVVATAAFEARAQAWSNARLILAVTGCLPTDSAEECAKRQRDREIAEGTRRIAEVDCVTRRALAGLPAPDPTRFCTEQTPPAVYPG